MALRNASHRPREDLYAHCLPYYITNIIFCSHLSSSLHAHVPSTLLTRYPKQLGARGRAAAGAGAAFNGGRPAHQAGHDRCPG